jgi:hypothetical protein
MSRISKRSMVWISTLDVLGLTEIFCGMPSIGFPLSFFDPVSPLTEERADAPMKPKRRVKNLYYG